MYASPTAATERGRKGIEETPGDEPPHRQSHGNRSGLVRPSRVIAGLAKRHQSRCCKPFPF
eukprot:scaffold550_cov238-Pinguiococcus_pyrenoidosus.AAC.9